MQAFEPLDAKDLFAHFAQQSRLITATRANFKHLANFAVDEQVFAPS